MDKAAVYELEMKGSRPLFGGYFYDWPEQSGTEQSQDDDGHYNDGADAYSDLEKLQRLHMFNR